MKKTFLVQYGGFSFWVKGYDFKSAQKSVDKWNIGGLVLGEIVGDEKPTDPSSPNFPHWIIFLSWIAIKSGICNEDSLSDTGVFHEMIHMESGINIREKDDILKEYRYILEQLSLV